MIKRSFLLLCVYIVSALAFAWTPNGETVTIDEIIQWQDNDRVVFKLSSGYRCFIPQAEDNDVVKQILPTQLSYFL